MIQVFLVAVLLSLGLGVPGTALAKRMVTDNCRDFDLRAAKVGFACRTSKEKIFRLVHRAGDGAEIWLDRFTGLHWGDKLPDRIRRKAAAVLCTKAVDGRTKMGALLLNQLPTINDFETAEHNGFREVLPNMKDHYYWIDSSVPGAKNIGHMFNGNIGKPEIVVYRSINFENIRCVGREVNPR